MAETIEVLQPDLAHRGPGRAARPPDGRPHRLPHPRPPARALTGRRAPGERARRRPGRRWPVAGRRRRLPARVHRPGRCRGSGWPLGLRRRRPGAAAGRSSGIDRRSTTLRVVLPSPSASCSSCSPPSARRSGSWLGNRLRPDLRAAAARSPTDRVARRASPALVGVGRRWPGCSCRCCADARAGPASSPPARRVARALDDHLPAAARPSARRCARWSARTTSRRCSTRFEPDARPRRRRRRRAASTDDVAGRVGPIGREGRGRRPAAASRTAPAGSWPTTWSSPTPTSWRARRDRGRARRRPPPRRRRWWPSTPTATWPCSASPGLDRPALPGGRRRRRARPAACSATPAASRCASPRSRSRAQIDGHRPRHLRRRRRPTARCSCWPPTCAPATRARRWSTRRRGGRASPSPSRPTSRAWPTPWRPRELQPAARRRRTTPRSSTGRCLPDRVGSSVPARVARGHGRRGPRRGAGSRPTAARARW